MKINKLKYFSLLILLFSSLLFTGCNESAWDSHVSNDALLNYKLDEAIARRSDLSIFNAVLKKTGYNQLLANCSNYTVFAPTNSAWAGVDTTDVTKLEKMLAALIVYKSYYTDMSELYNSVKSISGKNIYCALPDSTFNGAKIIDKNYRTANGVIQITDKIVERRNNIWEQLSTKTDYNQYKFINSLNKQEMDEDKSVAIGVNAEGKVKYDTVWKNVNGFLSGYPIDNEDSTYTYIIIKNDNYNTLYNKYKPYYLSTNTTKTDSIVNQNVCQDFVFKGIVDITKVDTLTNVDGVKIPVLNGSGIEEVYNSSNGRVYVLNAMNVRLKDKIKPIKIEGENYNKAYDASYIFKRYKLWASGERDIAFACSETQSDTLWRKTTGIRDSVASKTYSLNSNFIANVANFYIEYKAQVNSASYDIYYVAYDDISDHADPTYTNFGVYNVTQKLFVSMPGSASLQRGLVTNINTGVSSTTAVVNNYLGDMRCFAGVTPAGKKTLTHLQQWDLDPSNSTQVLSSVVSPATYDMVVPRTGTLTMWLCNTARSTSSSKQGLLFLDYILLVPRINE